MTPSGSSSVSRERGPRLLLVDTNILLRAVRPGFAWQEEVVRVLGPVRSVVPASVLRELDRLSQRGVTDAQAARALAERLGALPNRGEGDDALLDLSVRRHAAVLTADRALAERLRAAGQDVLVPRDRTRLELRRARRDTARTQGVQATVKKRVRLGKLRRTGSGHHAR